MRSLLHLQIRSASWPLSENIDGVINRKCDRCGRDFNYHPGCQMGENNYSIQNYAKGIGLFAIDLCPDCQRDFHNWLAGNTNGLSELSTADLQIELLRRDQNLKQSMSLSDYDKLMQSIAPYINHLD